MKIKSCPDTDICTALPFGMLIYAKTPELPACLSISTSNVKIEAWRIGISGA